jgi:hypothetical protein
MLLTSFFLSAAFATPPLPTPTLPPFSTLCSSPFPAGACACDSMFALELANQFGLESCDTDSGILGPTGVHTANEFAAIVYESPFNPSLSSLTSETSYNMDARTVPRCEDGTDSCDPGSWLRCVDGTRPIYWVDYPEDASDAWVFSFQGGGSCGRSDMEQGGESCWSFYNGYESETNAKGKNSRVDMTGWHLSPEGAPLHDFDGPLMGRLGYGINSSDSEQFSQVNRVYVPKCGFDRNNGTVTISEHAGNCPAGWDCSRHQTDPDSGGRAYTNLGDSFYLPFHGRPIVSAILADLIQTSDPDEPDLFEATSITFAGHSGGAHGLINNLDSLAEEAEGIAPTASIRGVIDARGWPTLNHVIATERAPAGTTLFDRSDMLNMFCADCLPEYVDPDSGMTVDQAITAANFRAGSPIDIRSAYTGVMLDSTCTSQALAKQHWRCQATGHVLWNHLSTPFFLRQAVEDSKHIEKRSPEFARSSDWRWTAPADYRSSTIRQIRDVQAWGGTQDPGTGPLQPDGYSWMDPTDPIGLGLFFPESDSHPGLFDGEFLNSTMANTDCATDAMTYEQALHAWLYDGGETVFISPEVAGGVDGDITCP